MTERRGDAWPHTSRGTEAAAAAKDRELMISMMDTIKRLIGFTTTPGGHERINARFNALEARVDALERPPEEVPAAALFAELERMVGEIERLAEKVRQPEEKPT